MLKALFDQQKGAKSWWIDNDVINAKCLKSKGHYRIVTKKSDLIAEYSTNGTTWRKKFDGTEKEIIKKITEHNNKYK